MLAVSRGAQVNGSAAKEPDLMSVPPPLSSDAVAKELESLVRDTDDDDDDDSDEDPDSERDDEMHPLNLPSTDDDEMEEPKPKAKSKNKPKATAKSKPKPKPKTAPKPKAKTASKRGAAGSAPPGAKASATKRARTTGAKKHPTIEAARAKWATMCKDPSAKAAPLREKLRAKSVTLALTDLVDLVGASVSHGIAPVGEPNDAMVKLAAEVAIAGGASGFEVPEPPAPEEDDELSLWD